MEQLVRVDRRSVLPFRVEKTNLSICILDTLTTFSNTVLPANVDTIMVETDRVEKVKVESVAVLP
jgi:hypothetical protein